MKRSFIIAGLTLVLITAVGYALLRQSSQGTLEISSEKNAEISVWVRDDTTIKRVGKTKAKLRLAPGNYTAVATKDSRETQAIITVTAGKTTTVELALQATLAGERIGQYSARNITAVGSTLTFVNMPARQLYTVAPPAQPQRLLPELYPVAQVYWGNPGAGIAQLENGTLWAITGGKSTPILLPEGSETTLKPLLTMAEGGSFAIAYDSTAYFYANVSAEPKKVADLADPAARIALSSQGLLYVYSDPAASAGESEGGAPASIFNVHTGLAVNTVLTSVSVNEAVWSPDGRQLALVSNSDLLIYDLSANRFITASKQAVAGNSQLLWDGTETIIFPQARGLYSLTVALGKANLLVENDDIEHPGAVSVVGRSLYTATTPAPQYGSVGEIFRYQLR